MLKSPAHAVRAHVAEGHGCDGVAHRARPTQHSHMEAALVIACDIFNKGDDASPELAARQPRECASECEAIRRGEEIGYKGG
jgi:hypothetical protein